MGLKVCRDWNFLNDIEELTAYSLNWGNEYTMTFRMKDGTEKRVRLPANVANAFMQLSSEEVWRDCA